MTNSLPVLAASTPSSGGPSVLLILFVVALLVGVVILIQRYSERSGTEQSDVSPTSRQSAGSASPEGMRASRPSTGENWLQRNESKIGIAWAAGSALWKLLGVVVVVLVIWAYIWGGSNQAHLDCAAHRFGDPSLTSQFACVVEH